MIDVETLAGVAAEMAEALADGEGADGEEEAADAAVGSTLAELITRRAELITLDSEGGLPSFPQLLPALLHAIRMSPPPVILSNFPRLGSQLHKLHAAAGPLLLAVQAGDASRGADAKLGPWLASHGVPIHTLAGARDDLSAVVNAVASAIGRARDTSPFESAAAEAADRDLEAEAADRNLEAEAADRNLEAEAKTQTEAETQAKVAAEPETEAQAEVEAQPEVAAEPDLQANAAEELLADTLYEITFGKLEAEAEAQALALAEAEVEAQAEVEALAEKLLAAALFEATFGEVEAQAQAEAEAEAAPFHAVVTRLPDANYAVNITLRQRGDGGAHMLPIPA